MTAQGITASPARDTRFANANTAARAYLDMGFDPIPIPAREKAAKCKWTERLVTKDNIDAHILSDGNVAVVMGARSGGLIDFDFDNPVAVEIAELLIGLGAMPDGPVFGRASNPSSHRLFRCADAGRHWDSTMPDALAPLMGAAKSKIVEVRGNGCYTVMPGSTHRDTGEPVEFECDDLTLPEITWADAVKLGGLISFLSVVTAAYPGEGARHDACLALAGAMVKAGYDADLVDEIVVAIAQNAGDEEAQRRRFAKRTGQLHAAGKAVAGLTKLCEVLGLSEFKRSLASWLFAADEDYALPSITLYPGRISDAVDKAEDALIAAGVGIYQRGGELVRPCRFDQKLSAHANDNTSSNELAKAKSALVLAAITETWLLDQLSRIVRWQRPAKGDEGYVSVDPPAEIAKRLIARKGDWKFPVIRGVVETPTLRADHSILQEPGFDAASGLYLDTGGAQFGRLEDYPTKADAEVALERIIRLFRCFPFAPDDIPEGWQPVPEEGLKPSSSRSVVLSAVLTGLIRRSMRTAPLHGIDAPSRGSGKSLIADLVSTILTGRPANVVAWTGIEAEDEKRLFAALLQGDPTIFIDNVERPMEGAALCAVLTSPEWNSRVLKESRNVTVSTAALFMATGNNLTFKGDMTRRTVLARLDPRVDKPEDRKFSFDPRESAKFSRNALVMAGLTILRAYIAAGCPARSEVSHVGSFEDWTLVREALVWLGQPDPAVTRARVQENDPETEELAEVMAAWRVAIGGRKCSVREALNFALEGRNPDPPDKAKRGEQLQLLAAFEQVSFDGKVNARRLGHWFKRRLGRLVDGMSFESAGKDSHKSQLIVLHGVGRF